MIQIVQKQDKKQDSNRNISFHFSLTGHILVYN